MNITTKLIEELAPNAAAAKNGRDLVSKNKFSNLKKSEDDTVIWGECAGSGKNPYMCSVDFIDENNPISRCNCPSRQFPCKHGLGLMYAYEKGLTFNSSDIPEDILSKREKIEKKQEKKTQEKETIKEKAEKPKKINKAAIIKKAEAQLTGIDLAEKLLRNIIQMGLSSVDAQSRRTFSTQIKELGNYYINGIQTAFNNLMLELDDVENDKYTRVIDQINFISALLKKSKDYLNSRKENPEAAVELNSAIEEQIGYVWKLVELMENGLWEENAEIVQLSFNNYDDPARKEYIDQGYWINLKTGKIYSTKNYRPYRAAKYIKEDNSIFDVLQTPELFIYPGDINPRARWDSAGRRDVTQNDITTIINYASSNYADLVKTIKGSIKNPLMDKNPVALIKLHKSHINGEHLVIEDEHGNVLTVMDMPYEEMKVEHFLKSVIPSEPKGYALLVKINNDVESGLFSVQPLSLITPEKIIRLLY